MIREILLFLFIVKSVLLANALNACGVTKKTGSFIINGTDTIAWPWIAAIYTAKEKNFICGGTLIAPNLVITAAHCLQDKREVSQRKPEEIIVKLGKTDLSVHNEIGSVDSNVINIIIHPEWNPFEEKFSGDAAILVLQSDVKLTGKIQPICLRTQNKRFYSSKGTVVGWGKSENSARAHENIPKQLEVTIKSNENCFLKEPRLTYISSSTTFCAGRSALSGPCKGDSGSGLYTKIGSGSEARWYLRGIVSAGILQEEGNCDTSVDAIFTDLKKIIEWVKDSTETKITKIRKSTGSGNKKGPRGRSHHRGSNHHCRGRGH